MNNADTCANRCPVCGSTQIQHILSIDHMPVLCNVLWKDRAGAQSVKRGNIRLEICRECAHIYNSAFYTEQMIYGEGYENSLHFSPRFQQYALDKAAELVSRYRLKKKNIVEIGSGRGDFLNLLVDLGKNNGTGFDPSYAGPPSEDQKDQLSFIQDYYTEKYSHLPADFILSRHVLEHIPDPLQFLTMLRRIIGGRQEIKVFFEVPNGLYTLRELGIWDIIYEHCSYFTAPSLQHVFQSSGFEVLRTDEAFQNQYLTIEAQPSSRSIAGWQNSDAPQAILQYAQSFAGKYREKVSFWQERIQQLRETDQKTVIWGAGSKGITFLNTFQASDVIEYVVDINPRKEGMYITGSGQKIVPPAFLRTYQPAFVIIMNENYLEEIQGQLQDLGVTASVLLA